MRKRLVLAGSAVLCLQTGAGASQTADALRARFVNLLETRLQSEQPMRLSADRITVTGHTLRLEGHARLWFDETAIRAEHATLDTDTNEVTLSGNVNALLGRRE